MFILTKKGTIIILLILHVIVYRVYTLYIMHSLNRGNDTDSWQKTLIISRPNSNLSCMNIAYFSCVWHVNTLNGGIYTDRTGALA